MKSLLAIFSETRVLHAAKSFELDPDLTYLDVGRKQWIAVHPFGYIGDWEKLEGESRTAFDASYGPKAAPAAQALGASLTPRLTFGWAAMTEKVLATDHGIDDVSLELTKMSVLRSGQPAPISAQTELRLAEVKPDLLVMSWIIAETGVGIETLGVPRDLYDDIAADQENWQELRGELEGRMFVDMQRFMLATA